MREIDDSKSALVRIQPLVCTQQGQDRETVANADSLLDVARRIDGLLRSVRKRLSAILSECENSSTQEAVCGKQRNVFQRERDAWERQRQEEIERIRAECDRLAEAWKQLEDQQRNQLGGQNGSAHDYQNANAGNAAFGVDHSDASSRPAVVEADVVSSHQQTAIPYASPESVLLQFQQLKREIRKHVRRNP